MAFFNQLKNLFSGTPFVTDEDRAVHKIFEYLLGLISGPDMVEQKKRVAKALSARPDGRVRELLRCYFELEQFITSHAPPVVNNVYTEQTLRQNIRERLGSSPRPQLFRLVFMPQAEQQFEIYEMGIKNLSQYLIQQAGAGRLTTLLMNIAHGTQLEQAITKKGIDFSMLQELRRRTSNSIALAQYKQIYLALFSDISTLFGEQKAITQSHLEYEFFKTTYDKNLTAQFLSILPEKVLEVEQLAYMSREELQRKITERTEALSELNGQLEKKVLERTQELKQKVDELSHANQHLLELDQAKTEFISIAAHQLRTPLTALKWVLSLLINEKMSNLTDEQKELLSSGYESNERMINLINEMLIVMRIESGKMLYTPSSFSIVEVIQSVLVSFTGLAHEQHVELMFNKPDTPLPWVTADIEKIRSVLQNLVENALNYSREGGVVTISATPQNEFVEVCVVDQGIGIPINQQVSIFDKFYRADNAASLRPAGSGLGLFVAKNIVENSGGVIAFESAENAGSTFRFTLPCAVSAK